MDLETAERQKFIIPHLRTPNQPGLEVHREVEEDAASSPLHHPLHPVDSRQQFSPYRSPEPSFHHRGPDPSIHQPDPSVTQRTASQTSAGPSPFGSPYLRSSSSSVPVSGLHLRNGPRHYVLPPGGFEPFKYEGESPSRRETPRVLGLSVAWFWAAVAACVVVIAAGLGAGLAVGLSNSHHTPNVTSTGTASATIINQQGVASPAPVNPWCPGRNGTVVTPYDASGTPIKFNNEQAMSFQVLCDTYWPAKQSANPGLRTIAAAYAPDMLACMALCAEFNAGYSDAVGDDVEVGGGICVGVALIRAQAEFCYLQNATGTNDTSAANGNPVDSAVLVGPWAGYSKENLTWVFNNNGQGG
ncbi:hypothetical protein NKR23_g2600 [Pleurostoma richardsiae]|uniref:Uncharacterized protein n=1 Tax=Pleurostoma richardsiae TaxID=41990 RepID=A0AA38RPJ5_9PEZI|nr:hypothetical protein NKR23_g2600 [Pleurostoma richardsiae]